MNLTLAQIFGQEASQTLTTVTIQKSALQGLVSSADNHAEAILAAIMKTGLQQFQGWLTDPDGNPVLSPDNLTVDYDNSALYDVINIKEWRTQFIDKKIRHNFSILTYSLYAD
ncbi:hypothetical protein [Nostoc sp.]|uniref:hypothetical protein n=1 Tax=Nostoc sp. TaxID=1180 RepID=UPI002FF4846F